MKRFIPAAALGLFGAWLVLAALPAPASPPWHGMVPKVAVLIERDTFANTPDGTQIALPAGTYINACGPRPLIYQLDARIVRMPKPCQAVLADGFEDE